MIKLAPIAITCLIVASPALSQNNPAASQNANPAKPKLICETQQETGSRLDRKRVCHTAEEWQRVKADARDAIDKYQQQATGTPVSG